MNLDRINFGGDDLAVLADFATRDDVVDALRGVRDEVRDVVASAKTELAMAVADAVDRRIDERVALALAQYRGESELVRDCFEQAMLKLEAVVKALPAPSVTVAPAEVTVEVPRRKVTKTITYDPDGKPSTITEEEN